MDTLTAKLLEYVKDYEEMRLITAWATAIREDHWSLDMDNSYRRWLLTFEGANMHLNVLGRVLLWSFLAEYLPPVFRRIVWLHHGDRPFLMARRDEIKGSS